MAPAWRVLLDEALLLSHPRRMFICLVWVRNFCLEQPQRFEGSKQGKSEWHCFFEMEEYCPKEGFLFPWWSLCQQDPQTCTATQLGAVLLVQKGSIGVLYQFSCGAVAVFITLSCLCIPVPGVGGLAARWSGRGATEVQCDMGATSRVLWRFSVRKATQSYLVGPSLRTALISGSSSLPVGVNMLRWAVKKC